MRGGPSFLKVTVYGKASQKNLITFDLSEIPENQHLMEFLRSLELPIASSCWGEGVCQKCQIQLSDGQNIQEILSCQYLRKDLENFYQRGHNNQKSGVYLLVSYL